MSHDLDSSESSLSSIMLASICVLWMCLILRMVEFGLHLTLLLFWGTTASDLALRAVTWGSSLITFLYPLTKYSLSCARVFLGFVISKNNPHLSRYTERHLSIFPSKCIRYEVVHLPKWALNLKRVITWLWIHAYFSLEIKHLSLQVPKSTLGCFSLN